MSVHASISSAYYALRDAFITLGSEQNLPGTRAGQDNRGRMTFFQEEKGGPGIFFQEKKGGTRTFFQEKKWGASSFSNCK